MITAFERRLIDHLCAGLRDIEAATPSLRLQVYQRGQKRADVSLGEEYRYYDLASLTKIIFTGSILMRRVSAKRLDPEAPLRAAWPNAPLGRVTLNQLMTHTAGLPWWLPLYKKLKGQRTSEHRWPQVVKCLSDFKRERQQKAIYSDVDLLMIGALLTESETTSLRALWQELQGTEKFGGLHFNEGSTRKHARRHYAPTENCPWRKRVLRGEVHDENAWAMGGIAPHAGLFGGMDDVSAWGLELRRGFLGGQSVFGAPRVIKRFTGRRISRDLGDWGWLFMKPTRGRASCGRHFSLSSFGHTGFTGTSLWFDPRQDLLVVILSNRVHPTRQNQNFVKLRPQLHDWICESLPRARRSK